MNPELLNRIQAGSFVKITFSDDVPVSGYIANDPSSPGFLRLDGYWVAEEGCLQEISLKLAPEEISAVDFLPESPAFTDREGHSLTMAPGFFKHLD
jgi:hypothetical protein